MPDFSKVLPLRLRPSSWFARRLFGTSAAIIGVLLLVFAGIAVAIQGTVRNVIAQQEAIRLVDVDRSLVLRLQVDEETGIRGFLITGSRVFLAPFSQARARMPRALALLERHLHATVPSLVPLASELSDANAAWIRRYAMTAIANPAAAKSLALELREKGLVDRIRALSSRLETSLDAVADARDRSAAHVVDWILALSGVFGFLLASALLYYLVVQARMGRALSAQAHEYDRLRRIATTLQEAFLVEPLPRVPSLALDAVYAPALEEARVGGDWYGVFQLPDGRLYFSMGDIAGHGVAASVTMARTRQTILSIAMHELDPAVVLARANEVIRLRGETMITALVGFVDPQTFEVTYASAGHPSPLLVTETGEAFYLPTSGAPLGIAPDPAARTFVRRVTAGSTLILYTDGIVEFDRDVLHGERRLKDVAATVVREGDEHPASAILRRTLGAAAARDDIALLAIGFGDRNRAVQTAATGALVASWDIDRARPQSARDARNAFVAEITALGRADPLASEVIFGELVANALEHGAGSIRVDLYETPDGLLLCVADAGRGVAKAGERLAKTVPHTMAPRGRGLHIVRTLAREVRVAEEPTSVVRVLLPQERASESA